MDWIKKYNEKLTLAASLFLLIIVAVFLAMKISRLREEIHNTTTATTPTTKRFSIIDLTTHSNAIALLQSPALWTNEKPVLLFPPIAAPSTGVVVTITHDPVIRLTSITKRPFSLRFESYLTDPDAKDGASDFQINYVTGRRTIFVKQIGREIADKYGKTGYFLTKFEHKLVEEDDPTLGGKITRDYSALTVKHEGEQPIVLVKNKVAHHPRRYAQIIFTDKSQTLELSIGDTFNSAEKSYKVVDITEKELLYVNTKSNEEHKLSLTVP